MPRGREQGKHRMGWEEGEGHVILKELVFPRKGIQKFLELFAAGMPLTQKGSLEMIPNGDHIEFYISFSHAQNEVITSWGRKGYSIEHTVCG